MLPPQDIHKPQGATFVVAASDSLHKERADYVCDGVGDQVEIQAAIDALPSQGGLIHFSSGKYYISDTINVNHAHTIFEGEGARYRGTIFYLVDGANCDMIDVSNEKFKMKYMELDGNKNNQTTEGIKGVYEHGLLGSDPTFINVYGWHVKGDCFHISGSHGSFINCIPERSGRGIFIDGGRETRIIGCLIYANTEDIKISGRVADNGGRTIISGCYFHGNSTIGLVLEDTDHNVISGCGFYDCSYPVKLTNADWNIISDCEFVDTRADAFKLVNSSDNLFDSLLISSARTRGFYIKDGCSNNTISNSHIKNVSTLSNNAYCPIEIKSDGAASLYNVIHNNVIRSTDANKHKWAIQIDSSQDYTKVTENVFRDHQTAGLYIGSFGVSHIVVRDNIGWVTKNSGTSTGTGAQQPIAHGLAKTPTKVILWNIEDGANPYQSAVADGTNIYVLAVINQDWGWEAEVV